MHLYFKENVSFCVWLDIFWSGRNLSLKVMIGKWNPEDISSIRNVSVEGHRFILRLCCSFAIFTENGFHAAVVFLVEWFDPLDDELKIMEKSIMRKSWRKNRLPPSKYASIEYTRWGVERIPLDHFPCAQSTAPKHRKCMPRVLLAARRWTAHRISDGHRFAILRRLEFSQIACI